MKFSDVLYLGIDVLNDKYVRMSLRLLGNEVMGIGMISNISISYKSTIDSNIIPLYESLISLYKYDAPIAYDRTTGIRCLVMYTILRSKYSDRKWNIFYDRHSRFIVSDGNIVARTQGYLPEHGDRICTIDEFDKNTSPGIRNPRMPDSLYRPGANIDLILYQSHNILQTWERMLERDNVIFYKLHRLAKTIFTDIPPCNNKKVFDFKRDIDFIFQ